MSIQITTILTQPFAENTYLAYLEGSGKCVVVDPGLQPRLIQNRITELRLIPDAILNTHGHADHIAGNDYLKRCWPGIPLIIGTGDASKLTNPDENLSAQFGIGLVSPPADRLVQEGDTVQAAGLEFHVLETPGHSRGHVVFICKQFEPWVVLGGDVLFQEGVGRSDFPDGSFAELERSIRTKLYPLPADTIIYPGHGEPTTIGHEREHNPFVRGVG